MERGDIYLVLLDPTSGHEQQGVRPVLIVSPGAFNRLTRTPVVLPIASGGFARTAGFAVSLVGAGTEITGVVRCDRPRALDLSARRGRKLGSVPAAIVDEAMAKLSAILEQPLPSEASGDKP